MKLYIKKSNIVLTMILSASLITPQAQAINFKTMSQLFTQNKTAACLVGTLFLASSALGYYAYTLSSKLEAKNQKKEQHAELQKENVELQAQHRLMRNLLQQKEQQVEALSKAAAQERQVAKAQKENKDKDDARINLMVQAGQHKAQEEQLNVVITQLRAELEQEAQKFGKANAQNTQTIAQYKTAQEQLQKELAEQTRLATQLAETNKMSSESHAALTKQSEQTQEQLARAHGILEATAQAVQAYSLKQEAAKLIQQHKNLQSVDALQKAVQDVEALLAKLTASNQKDEKHNNEPGTTSAGTQSKSTAAPGVLGALGIKDPHAELSVITTQLKTHLTALNTKLQEYLPYKELFESAQVAAQKRMAQAQQDTAANEAASAQAAQSPAPVATPAPSLWARFTKSLWGETTPEPESSLEEVEVEEEVTESVRPRQTGEPRARYNRHNEKMAKKRVNH